MATAGQARAKSQLGNTNALKLVCKRGHQRTPENLEAGRGCRLCRSISYAAKAADPEWRKWNYARVKAWRHANRKKLEDGMAARPTEEQRIEWEKILEAEGLGMGRGSAPWKISYGFYENRDGYWADGEFEDHSQP